MAESLKIPTPSKKKSVGKRLGLLVGLISLLLIVVIIGFRIFLTTDPGADFVENQVNKRSFGAVESIEISGLSGNPFGEFSLEGLKVKDKDGIWLEAKDVSMEWRPLSLLRRHVNIVDVKTGSIDVLRKPQLNNVESSGSFALPKISLGSLYVNSVNLDSSLIGRKVRLQIEGKFLSEYSGQMTSLLKISSVDVLGDILSVDISWTSSGRLSGTFDISGTEDGPIAALIKAPSETSVSGTGQIEGTDVSGEASLNLNFGAVTVVTAHSDWTDKELSLEGRAAMAAWPALNQLTGRIGNAAEFNALLNRDSKNGFNGQPFNVKLNTENITVEAEGELSETAELPRRTKVSATIARPERLMELPEGYELGVSDIKGLFSLSPNLSFEGRLNTARIVTPWGNAHALNGPVILMRSDNDSLNVVLDVTAKNIEVADFDNALGSNATLGLTAQYDPASQMVNAKRFEVKSGAQSLSAQGQVSVDLSMMDIQGNTALTIPADLGKSANIPAGKLVSDFVLEKTALSDIALSTMGRYDLANRSDGPLESLIGSHVVYSAAMIPIVGGANLDRFRVETPSVIAEISGTLNRQLNFSGEIQTLSPINFENMVVEADTRASFQVSGLRSDPAIRLEASSPNLRVNSFDLEAPRLRAELSNLLAAPSGPVLLKADTQYGALSGQANLSLGDIKRAKDVEILLGDITANGDISVDGQNLATGTLDARLANDGARSAIASLRFKPEGEEQGLVFNFEAESVAYQKIGFDSVMAKVEGTLERLAGSFVSKGTYDPAGDPQSFEINSPLEMERGLDGMTNISAMPKGLWNGLSITAPSPVTLAIGSQDLKLKAPISIDGNNVDLTYLRQSGRESFIARATNVPMRLFPMPGALADSRGRLSADINLRHEGGSLGGTTTLALSDWRGFEVASGKGLNAEFDVTYGTSSNWTLGGSSDQGFAVSGAGAFSMMRGTSLFDTRLNMSASVSGEFEANGPAETLLGLLTPANEDMDGQFDMALSLSGSAANPLLKGKAQGRDLKFEVPEIGTQIRQGVFTADFTNDTLTLSNMSMRDKNNGSLKAQGDFKLGPFGRPIGTGALTVTNFTALDRRDITAVFDGSLEFESTEKASALSGDMTIDKANLRQFVSAAASVIEIEVEEINRPPELEPISVKPSGNPINLDVNIRAPRNILVNSKGLDIELSMDTRVIGTIGEPQFFGTATVLRGGYKIAGKILAFESGSIEFNGPLEQAKVSLKAQTQTQNMAATVEIAGTVKSPEITLSSSPERPQDEVLSALLFGRSATELSAIESLQLASALAQFSGVGSGFDLLGGLRESLGISQLNIGTAADGTTQISGGRYLAENVYLQLFSGANLSQTGAIIDWEIKPDIALRSKILADNDQSLSLKWKKDF